jgi:hypothetical protein
MLGLAHRETARVGRATGTLGADPHPRDRQREMHGGAGVAALVDGASMQALGHRQNIALKG